MSGRTTVDLLWIKGRTERWIRFGRIVQDTLHSRSESTVGFDTGQVFAFVRWASNEYGTVESRIDILHAVQPGERCSTVPHVTPGGEMLLRLSGCRHGTSILVDGAVVVEARERDRLDRPLPVWRGCRTLRSGEVFFLNAEHPSSLDGRYFGPLDVDTIIGRATPIWTREG